MLASRVSQLQERNRRAEPKTISATKNAVKAPINGIPVRVVVESWYRRETETASRAPPTPLVTKRTTVLAETKPTYSVRASIYKFAGSDAACKA